MRPIRLALVAVLLAASALPAAADPAPARRVETVEPRAGALFAAAVAAGDWRLHPDESVAQTWTSTALLSLDTRGLHAKRSRLALAATGVALIGALLIASERDSSWCHGARCDVGEAALLVAAPLLDAAARQSESGR